LSIASNEVNVLVRPDSYLTLHYRITLASGPGKDSVFAEHAGADATFEPGDLVEFTAPNGGRYSGVLKEINDESALFDFNHPLAGISLRVDVALLGVL
jgi:hypothetical protein